MSTGIGASDRKILLLGGALLVLMLAATVVFAPPGEQGNSSVPSTYSTQSGGAKAAYVLLTQLRFPVRRWENPPTELDVNPRKTLLILAEPLQPPSEKEKKVLGDFVKNGGHVLFAGAGINTFFPNGQVSETPSDPVWNTMTPAIPNRLTQGAQHITMQRRHYWKKVGPTQLELYGDTHHAAVVSWKLGDGEILWWMSSTPLTNAGISKDDNLSFFLNSVMKWSTGQPATIYWDEYFHGQRSSLWSYVGKTSLAWSLAQFGLLAVVIFFTFSRRSGPIFVPAGVSRLWPLEFVDTLGGLYERAGAASSAVLVSYRHLRSLLMRQLGLPPETPNAELGQKVEQRLGWKDAGLEDLLRRADAASRNPRLKPREALDLVQKLEEYAARLNVRASIRKENR
jgi:hypothetical protein